MADDKKTKTEWTMQNLKIRRGSETRQFYATWNEIRDSRKDDVTGIEVQWRYSLLNRQGNEVWQSWQSAGTIGKSRTSSDMYTADPEAVQIDCRVKPVLVTNKKDRGNKIFTVKWANVKARVADPDQQPDKPGNVILSQDDTKIVCEYTNTDPKATSIQFILMELLSGAIVDTSEWIKFNAAGYAKWEHAANPDTKYSAKCNLKNDSTGSISDDSDTEEYETDIAIPSTVTGLVATAISSTQIKLSWSPADSVASDNGYEIEYAEDESYFGSGNANSGTASQTNYTANVEAGKIYYFHVRAKNEDGKPGGWSNVVHVIAATKPNRPTIWSLPDNVVMIGDSVKLYWTHNSTDGSKPTKSEIALFINGIEQLPHIFKEHSLSPDDEDYTFNHILDIDSSFGDSDILKWQVRSCGIDQSKWSDWSNQRQIDIYAPIEIATLYPRVVTQYPINITASCLPITQTPISLYLSIAANETMESTDYMGNPIIIDKGEVIYKHIFTDFGNVLNVDLYPSDINLERHAEYILSITVAMTSGLSKTVEYPFSTSLEPVSYMVNSGINLDYNTLSAGLIPSCRYDEDSERDMELVPDILLDIYRINFDGSFTPIATGIENNGSTLITDPHPSLRYMRYRIVGIEQNSGSIFYNDILSDGFEDITGMVFQWDGKFQEFIFEDSESIDTNIIQSLSYGTMLHLPYNAKFSEDNNPEVELIDYIGNESSTSYYGTNKGRTAQWSSDIDKQDHITLEKLRRLQVYMGDVYCRNQYGIGYWANIKVNFNEDYDSLIVPVSIALTQVNSDRI